MEDTTKLQESLFTFVDQGEQTLIQQQQPSNF